MLRFFLVVLQTLQERIGFVEWRAKIGRSNFAFAGVVGIFEKFLCMSELIIRTENLEALKKIAEFLRSIGFEVKLKEQPKLSEAPASIPASGFDNGDVTDWLSFAGIWKDNPVTAEELRLKAWGGRI
jgi:hypothetical protein